MNFTDQCDKFEKGLGSILRNAWQHVEAIQTTDLYALINYITDVLQFTIDNPTYIESLLKSDDLNQRQEILVFYYLLGLFKNVEQIKESR